MKLLTPRKLRTAAAIIMTVLLGMLLAGMDSSGMLRLPQARERKLMRVWVASSVGGGQAWLKRQLQAWEKLHPDTAVYLRTVLPGEATEENTVLPDLVLYMPGDFAEPEKLFAPLTGETMLREELLRCGRWKGQQYGLPLCWGAWVLAVDGKLEPETAATPAPSTLLGRASVTQLPQATPEPPFPIQAANAQETAVQSPCGAALFTALMLLPEKPKLPGDFALLSPAEVYSGFRAGKYASALLTTGQLTAFEALTAAGKGFACRIMTADEVVTDQVWLGSVVKGASGEAAELLAYLTSAQAQKELTEQGLFSVRSDLRLYASSWQAQVENAAGRGLSALNAFLPAEETASAAWQVFEGRENISGALLPLL